MGMNFLITRRHRGTEIFSREGAKARSNKAAIGDETVLDAQDEI
jgi:hypothetical protein